MKSCSSDNTLKNKKKSFYSSESFDVKKYDQMTVDILINPDYRVVDLFGHDSDGRRKLIVSYCKKLKPTDGESEANDQQA